jgi:hypothetical protein
MPVTLYEIEIIAIDNVSKINEINANEKMIHEIENSIKNIKTVNFENENKNHIENENEKNINDIDVTSSYNNEIIIKSENTSNSEIKIKSKSINSMSHRILQHTNIYLRSVFICV